MAKLVGGRILTS